MQKIIITVVGAFFWVSMVSAAVVSSSESLASRSEAKGQALTGDFTDSTESWTTEGSVFCSTGILTCSSGRQIGCNATGDFVRCEYLAGDVGWVRCTGAGGGTIATFEDQCP